MYQSYRLLFGAVLGVVFSLVMMPAYCLTLTEDEMSEIRACNCNELSTYYKEFIDSEKEIEEAMKNNSKNQAATNVAGVATLAVVGIGFFEFGDPNEGSKEQLEDLRSYRKAIETVAKEKNCTLPQVSSPAVDKKPVSK